MQQSMTQQTWNTLTRPVRVRNVLDVPPALPEEFADPRERRRAQMRAAAWRRRRARAVQHVW